MRQSHVAKNAITALSIGSRRILQRLATASVAKPTRMTQKSFLGITSMGAEE